MIIRNIKQYWKRKEHPVMTEKSTTQGIIRPSIHIVLFKRTDRYCGYVLGDRYVSIMEVKEHRDKFGGNINYMGVEFWRRNEDLQKV